jgi:hypothetical protein
MIPTYFCPSRRGPQTVKYTSSTMYIAPAYSLSGELTHGLMDYAGCNLEGTGVLVRSGSDLLIAPRRMSDVTDGTTSTLAVAEKRLNLRYLGQKQQDDNEGYTAGWDEDTVRDTRNTPERDYVGDADGGDKFGSSHPSTFNSVFVDGSVHGLSYGIDAAVFNALGNIRDGKVVSGSDFYGGCEARCPGHHSGHHGGGSRASMSAAMSTASAGVLAKREIDWPTLSRSRIQVSR